MEREGGDSGTPTRAELLFSLSLAIDLGLGLPAEHVVRSALIAHRLAARLGCDESGQETALLVTMVLWIGCNAESHEYSRWFGDDISVRRDSYTVDWSGVPYAIFLLKSLGRGRTLPHRIKVAGTLLRDPRRNLATMTRSHCSSAALLAGRLGFGEEVKDALAYGFERWDGGGVPEGVAGKAIPLPMRIAHIADVADVAHTRRGVEGALQVLNDRSGHQFDPDVVACFVANHADLLDLPEDVWHAAVTDSPLAHLRSTGGIDLDELITALGDFADLKSPYTVGHSRSVAALVAAAARHAGLSASAQTTLRRAGHVHDLGRIGVSNLVWEKTTPLTAAERERLQLHPYFSGRILSRIPSLEAVSTLAVNHHERLDGSGYPNGLTARSLSLSDQLLAAADLWECCLEERPHRPGLGAAAAAERLRAEARSGRLHPDAVRAVLTAAGRSTPKAAWPAGLTGREVEVLRLVACATPTRRIAARLTISEKTVRNHIQHIYTKTDTSSRISLSLFAAEHGLV